MSGWVCERCCARARFHACGVLLIHFRPRDQELLPAEESGVRHARSSWVASRSVWQDRRSHRQPCVPETPSAWIGVNMPRTDAATATDRRASRSERYERYAVSRGWKIPHLFACAL